MNVEIYHLLLLLHVLLFVYWLGADLAVLYSARFAADARLSVETRLTISKIIAFIDLFPRLSVPLIGAVGAHLATLRGDMPLSPTGLGLIWLVALIWVANNIYIYARRAKPTAVQPWRLFDVIWRALIALGVTAAGVTSLLGAGVTENKAIATKLLLFAAAIILSLILRRVFSPFRPALSRIADGAGGDAEVTVMKNTLARSRPLVFCLWGVAIAAAAVGLWNF